MLCKAKKFIALLFLFMSIVLTSTCRVKGEDMSENSERLLSYDTNNAKDMLHTISQSKIFFSHQSVGYNIMEGLVSVADKMGMNLNIKETRDPLDFSNPIFAHYRVGKDTAPANKIADFSSQMHDGIGAAVDIAFFKFCYVNFDENTDLDRVFSLYKSTLNELKRSYPDTIFIHVTVPLVSPERGLKAMIKRFLGHDVREHEDNLAICQFNDMLRRHYEGEEPIFDLACIESTFPDGTRLEHQIDGKKYYSLVPEYTYDGGHLNELGRTVVAEKLLTKLAEILTQ